MNRTASIVAITVAAGMALVACVPEVKEGGPTDPMDEPAQITSSFRDAASLKPDALPPKAANLVLASAEIPVELKANVENGKMTLVWLADYEEKIGKPVVAETESYMFSDAGFSFVSGPHESFDPAIRLIKYPLTVGDKWDWNGKVVTGMTSARAKAQIETSADTLNIPYGNFGTLLVTVKMHMDTGTEGVNRTFKFWFKPGEGLIARELGQSSSRQPRTPDLKPEK